MVFMPRPMFAPPVGGLGQDAQRKLTLHCFGYTPDSGLDGALPLQHRGSGDKSIRCELSGEIFPISRIKRQWDGRMVGDIYYQEKPRVL